MYAFLQSRAQTGEPTNLAVSLPITKMARKQRKQNIRLKELEATFTFIHNLIKLSDSSSYWWFSEVNFCLYFLKIMKDFYDYSL